MHRDSVKGKEKDVSAYRGGEGELCIGISYSITKRI